MKWTNEKISRLSQLWSAGKSAREIANTMGENLTRNAVIGKVNRLGLKRAGNNAGQKHNPNSVPLGRGSTTRPYKPQQRTINNTKTNKTAYGCLKPLIDLEPNECRWPAKTIDNKHHLFCAGKTERNSSYCEAHTNLARKTL